MIWKDETQDEVIVPMLKDHTMMVTSIAAALSVERDPNLRATLRSMAPSAEDKPFLVSLLGGSAWIEVGIGNEVRVQRVQKERQPAVDILDALAIDPHFRARLYTAMETTSAHNDASNLLTSIIEADAFPTRAQFRQLRRWAPLIEHVAYRYAMRAGQLLDSLRPFVLDASYPDRRATMSSYWSALHLEAHIYCWRSPLAVRNGE